MTFDEYQERSRRTAIYPSMGSNIVYPVLGLGGEAGEVAEKLERPMTPSGNEWSSETPMVPIAEMGKEFGDVLWYAGAVCSEIGLPLGTSAGFADFTALQEAERLRAFRSRYELGLRLCGFAGKIQEKAKKAIRDSGGILTPEAKADIGTNMGLLLMELAGLCSWAGLDFDEVARDNIAKLESRQARGTLHGSGDNR